MKCYIYENWRAEKKAKIHRADCSHCNYGNGQDKKKSDSNGRWHGPFDNYNDALNTALNMRDRDVSSCGICKPNIKMD